MTAALALVDAPSRTSLNGHEIHTLDRKRKLDRAPGATIYRPTPDALPEVPMVGKLTARSELTAIRDACAALALLESRMRENDDARRDARSSGRKAELPKLAERGEELKQAHPTLRGPARVAIIATAEAAARRAGAEYNAACAMVGQAFAKLQAIAEFRDSLIGRNDFDPFGAYARMSLLAPAHQYRPAGWCVTPDAFGRDCYWSADSASHREEVRQVQQAFRNELTPAVAAAAWPF